MRITIVADFTDQEALAILQKVRDVEQARPEMYVGIWVVAPDRTKEQVLALMEGIQPPFKYSMEMEGRSVVDDKPPFSTN